MVEVSVVSRQERFHVARDFLGFLVLGLAVSGWGGVGSGGGGGRTRLRDAHMLKLSPQPHVPLMLGLLKTNSLESFDSTKSISVPSSVS